METLQEREERIAKACGKCGKAKPLDDGICGICGETVDQANWHLDHVIPLSRGGHHTYSNVQVSHPVCNMSKGARLPSEMRDRGNRSRA